MSFTTKHKALFTLTLLIGFGVRVCFAEQTLEASNNPLPSLQKNDSTKNKIVVRVSAMPHTVTGFEQVVAGRSCAEPIDVPHSFLRATYETLILCRALHLGGIEPNFQFSVGGGYEKTIELVNQGQVDISTETAWHRDIQNQYVLASYPLIASGQFEKGIYTTQKHPMQTQASAEIDLNEYKGVTVLSWYNDIALLNKITKSTFTTNNFTGVIQLLDQGRADYTLLRIDADPAKPSQFGDLSLYAVPNIKVSLPGSRHYIISQKSAKKDILLNALNTGLAAMKESGELDKHLISMGFINPSTKNWRILGQEH